MSARAWRPIGFLLLMLGFGLRLDSDWQALAWLLLAAGGIGVVRGITAAGAPGDSGAAFVRRPAE